MESRSKQSRWSPRAAGLVLVLLALVVGSAAAQVPQDMTFSGRLVDGGGTPLVGPVQLDLYIMQTATGNTPLYGERHLVVPLDAQGNFSVQLGAGDDPFFGSFDAATFSAAERYVEVNVVGPPYETLTPRVPLASVPWALVAQQANKIVPDPSAPRFEDCGDGTVADHQTGLQWEKKTGTPGTSVFCDTTPCPDPHDVNNTYTWSLASPFEDPDGSAFTDFLARLNGEYDPHAATGCFADRCDWQLPKISELQTILIGPEAAPGQATTCSGDPCFDPDFAAVGGTVASSYTLSASTDASDPNLVWYAATGSGYVSLTWKQGPALWVIAVRAGSCN